MESKQMLCLRIAINLVGLKYIMFLFLFVFKVSDTLYSLYTSMHAICFRV